jgi:YHS domain-containing protein
MKKISIILLLTLLVTTSFAQNTKKRVSEFNIENKVAIQGYDPVAYFAEKKALKGKATLTTTYEGIEYFFSSQANKDTFLKNPTNYEPQYGGWCAFAMGEKNEKVEINPETFKILDGKLYLFYNAFFNNTLKSWNKDEIHLKKKADANWKKSIN